MYKLIAMDVDGTLLSSAKHILPKTREWILKAQELGATIMLASGRPMIGLFHQAETMKLNTQGLILLGYNGSMIADATSKEIYYSHAIQRELAQQILESAKAFPITAMVYLDDQLIVTNLEGEHVQYEASSNGMKPVLNENIQLDFDPVKILFSAPQEILDALKDEFTQPFLGQVDFVKSAPFYLECVVKDVHKGEALKHYCEKNGIDPSEVMAFGDNYNDMTMIQFAGLGVAMGNAVDELKNIANHVTLSHDEEGIAAVLENHFG